MDIDKDASDAEQWKRKYFNQLEDAEGKEKQWQQADELLRKTISRLTLAADGQDATLDKQLSDLRNAIRDRASSTQLRKAIDAMSTTMVKLERERKQDDADTGNESVLLKLLDQLQLPKGTGRKTKQLRKLLNDSAASESEQAVSAFVGLFQSAMELSVEPDSGETTSAERGGLFQRLFGGQEKAADNHAPDNRDSPAPNAVEGGNNAGVREILIRLLERLSLPDDLMKQVDAIREKIEAASSNSSWDQVLEQIADLVQAIRTQTQKEKQGIEDFLLQLSERLQEVDRQLADSDTYYDDSFAASGELNSAVKEGMDDIQNSVLEATDLDQIKELVQTHIETVLTHMEKHRETEQQRYDAAKAEIATVTAKLNDVESEADALRTRIHEERSQAQTDALTGIPNRLAWEEQLEQEIARWKRFNTPLVLVIWDVDHFKKVNDTFGHKAGDKVLRTIARNLAGSIRETDFIARYGGEEFVHLMTGAELENCVAVADKLRGKIEATGFHFREQAVTITVSCGLTQFRDGDSSESWFERADRALYKAKQAGRNRCVSD
ncbi:GGDEF domain-containing protein [Pseudomonadota bacterium]